jgi:hypothetical protein
MLSLLLLIAAVTHATTNIKSTVASFMVVSFRMVMGWRLFRIDSRVSVSALSIVLTNQLKKGTTDIFHLQKYFPRACLLSLPGDQALPPDNQKASRGCRHGPQVQIGRKKQANRPKNH